MLKRMFLALVIVSFACAFAASCASVPPPPKAEKSEFEGAPKWVTQGCTSYWTDKDKKAEKQICGVGSTTGTRNIALARSAAIGRARTDIARNLQVQVQSALKDYQATTTGGQEFGKSAADEQHIQDVSKQITDQTLAGTELVDTWISPTGTMWVLVVLDVKAYKDAVSKMGQLSEAVRQAVTNRADKAFDELDKDIAKNRQGN